MRAALLILPLVLAGAASAGPRATFPGSNGPLVFDGVDEATHTVQVFRIGPDGTGLTELTNAGATEAWSECPAWSANGATIFFDGKQGPAAPTLIYRMNADGSGRALADRETASERACPSVGPGGAMVYAVQFPAKGPNLIVRQRVDGSGRRAVARAGRLQMLFQPVYAPDGKHVAFTRVTFGKRGQGIARSDVVVTNGRRTSSITRRSSTQFANPAWSPDGAQLLAVRGSAGSSIVRMTPHGTGVQVLLTVPGVGIESPVYSPDASKIAYIQCRGDCGDPLNPQGEGSIWVMNADGSGNHAILTQAAAGVQPATRVDWGVSP